MPKLSAFADNDELDNAISDKIVIYVEGADDVAFFRDLLGPDVKDRLEFKTPEDGTGYHSVKQRVSALRPRNAKIHGLLDGEAAVSLGLLEPFVECRDIFFAVEGEGLDGLIFLSENELENLILCHSKVAHFIARNVPIQQLGQVSVAEIERLIEQVAGRFYLFALVKFTMIDFHRGGTECKGIGKIGGLFLDRTRGIATIMRDDVQAEIGKQVDWPQFLERLRALAKRLRDRYDRDQLDPAGRKRETLRVADGKLMLKQLKSRYGGDNRWDGHLHGHIVESGYRQAFEQALFVRIGTNDNRPAAA